MGCGLSSKWFEAGGGGENVVGAAEGFVETLSTITATGMHH